MISRSTGLSHQSLQQRLGIGVLELASLHRPILKPQFCSAGSMPQPDVTKLCFFCTIVKRNPTWSPTLWHGGISEHPLGTPQLKAEISTCTRANSWTFVHQQDVMAAGQDPRQLPTQLLLFAATASAMQIQPGNRHVLCACPCRPSVSKVWTGIFN